MTSNFNVFKFPQEQNMFMCAINVFPYALYIHFSHFGTPESFTMVDIVFIEFVRTSHSYVNFFLFFIGPNLFLSCRMHFNFGKNSLQKPIQAGFKEWHTWHFNVPCEVFTNTILIKHDLDRKSQEPNCETMSDKVREQESNFETKNKH